MGCLPAWTHPCLPCPRLRRCRRRAANKIGTYCHAVAARHHGIPFFVAAPTTTLDPQLDNGSLIPIEERSPEEVRGSCCVLPCARYSRVPPCVACVRLPACLPACLASCLPAICCLGGLPLTSCLPGPAGHAFQGAAGGGGGRRGGQRRRRRGSQRRRFRRRRAAGQAAGHAGPATRRSIAARWWSMWRRGRSWPSTWAGPDTKNSWQGELLHTHVHHPRRVTHPAVTPSQHTHAHTHAHAHPRGPAVREVGDGNLNFVYVVEGPAGSLCVKQAPPFVRVVGESWPLTQVGGVAEGGVVVVVVGGVGGLRAWQLGGRGEGCLPGECGSW